MIAAERIVNELRDELKKRNIRGAKLRQTIIAFVIQQKSISGKEVFNLRKKKNRNEYYDYMDNLHSAFYNCINRKDI